MFRALYTAASGMDAQQRNIDVMANNIANVNTTGFRSGRAVFQELMYQEIQSGGRPERMGAPTGIEVGLGVRTGSTQRNFAQGNLEATESPLDLAIEGAGFFQVMGLDGQVNYTRAGAFGINADGQMVTQTGHEVYPPITIPRDATNVNIDRDGVVSINVPDDPREIEVGQIELASFSNPGGLRSLGRNLFEETDASGVATTDVPGENGLGEVAQGFLEGSNVNVVDEMVSMIVSQRAYEINSKVIRTADEMLRAATNMR